MRLDQGGGGALAQSSWCLCVLVVQDYGRVPL